MQLPPDVQRLQLPMRFYGAVNAWMIGQPGDRIIVDTGMPDQATADLWQQAREQQHLDGVRAIVLTHAHIDHVGQAGPLARALGAELFMSAREHAELLQLTQTDPRERAPAWRAFLVRGGFDPEAFSLPTDYRGLDPFPREVTILKEGEQVQLGGIGFEVIIGGGHSLAPICLLSRERQLLISGDQILAGAGPQIALTPERAQANELGDYLAFLDRMESLPQGLLVLPGHGEPFTDLHDRIAAIRRRHIERIERLSTRLSGEVSLAAMADMALGSRMPDHMVKRAPYVAGAMANYLLSQNRLEALPNGGTSPALYRKVEAGH